MPPHKWRKGFGVIGLCLQQMVVVTNLTLLLITVIFIALSHCSGEVGQKSLR